MKNRCMQNSVSSVSYVGGELTFLMECPGQTGNGPHPHGSLSSVTSRKVQERSQEPVEFRCFS